MRFGTIDRIILFGGSLLVADLVDDLLARGGYEVHVYTSDRHLAEPLDATGRTLEDRLRASGVRYVATEDINSEPTIRALVTKTSLGMGVGEAWSFDKDLIDLFEGSLLDFMGIRLPTYRGGAHYTWQILRGNRIGCANLQIINEDMVQGKVDTGEIVKSREYLFPAGARTPQDYFDAAVVEEKAFILEFLDEVAQGRDFPLGRVQEIFSMLFPRLHTMGHGFVDWSWASGEVDRFICAFDDPYAGASTFLDGKRVFLKKSRAESGDGDFHPFQAGLVYRVTRHGAYVCARGGTVLVGDVRDGDGRDLLPEIQPGQRFFTPREVLEQAMALSVDYGAAGVSGAGGGE